MLVNITYFFLVLHTPVDLPGGSITLGPAKSIIRIAGTASEFGYPEVYVSCRDLRKVAIMNGFRTILCTQHGVLCISIENSPGASELTDVSTRPPYLDQSK